MTFIIDGTNGLTFNNATTQASAGSILQVVNATYATQATTTSTTPVTTGFSASITPKFTTSKILVMVSCSVASVARGVGVTLQLWRGGSSIFSINPVGAFFDGSTCTQNNQTISEAYLDSPATTSSTTYTIYYNSFNAGTAYFCVNSNPSTITLLEIA
jgi:hypothetical protein